MNTGEVRALFDSYIDEGDLTFVSNAQRATYLKVGYSEFRRMVIESGSDIYNEDLVVTLAGESEYDLANGSQGTILGSAPTQARLSSLAYVAVIDPTTSRVRQMLQPVPTMQALQTTPNTYYLKNQKLLFSALVNGSVLINYVPESSVDWTAAADYIDDLGDWHDLIALLAAKQYLIRDLGNNPFLIQQLGARTADFRAHLMNRNASASPSYVTRTRY